MKALVVGGGPAGCSAALGLLKKGIPVTLLEQRTNWQGRVCGSFLSPEASRHLTWLGLKNRIMDKGAVPVRSCFLTTSDGIQSQVVIGQPDEPGLTCPRRELEDVLLQAVVEKGGGVLLGRRVTSYRKEGKNWKISARAKSAEEIYETELLIFADGRFSQGTYTKNSQPNGWYGWNARFEGIHAQPGDLSLHFYPGGYVGLLTFQDGTSNVSGLVYRSQKDPVSWEEVLSEARHSAPALDRTLLQARRQSDWKGVGPLPFTGSMRRAPDYLCVGDAAGVGDPFLGEGIGRALGAGPLLEQVLVKNKIEDIVADYQTQWKIYYENRLKFGQVTRAGLKIPFLYKTAIQPLIGSKRLSQMITTNFHQGFKS